MSEYFEEAKWIWTSTSAGIDEYGEFKGSFDAEGGRITCRISCDGDYTLFVNGTFVASNQYGDYEHYKIFDEIELSEFVRMGENEFSILVWHFGEDSSRYMHHAAGLIFEFRRDEALLLASNEKILCRKSSTYRNGYAKSITPQLGFSFLYDATKESEDGFGPSFPISKHCAFYPRPTKRLQLLPLNRGRILIGNGNYYLIDLGEETVGLASMSFFSRNPQKILVAWGEDLQNGHVRRIIKRRDFSFEYIAKAGENSYTNYMLRLGCRYLELYSEEPIELEYLGLIPQIYPVEEKKLPRKETLDQRIFDLCVRTLKLCMMEHYVDTPWREQCLYAFDSRNQMLCGYRVFEDGNAEYARANLLLMAQDRRDDGLLTICSPCSPNFLAIPAFSLYYMIAVREYLDHTGDLSLAVTVYEKLISIVETFLKNRKDGLVYRFKDEKHWNFYDWTDYLAGKIGQAERELPDSVINCLFILALENLRVISEKLGKEFGYDKILSETRARTREVFYDEETGLYSVTPKGGEFTVLANAFAILSGIATDPEGLCDAIVGGNLVDCSLSLRCFKYDALLSVDEDRYKPYVLQEIRRCYSIMLDADATSVWETEGGAEVFGSGAGSLCHGWSAVPILYL